MFNRWTSPGKPRKLKNALNIEKKNIKVQKKSLNLAFKA
jgi:hypothetical protein